MLIPQESSTLVFTGTGEMKNEQEIRALLLAAFEVSDFDEFQLQIFQYVMDNKDCWKSQLVCIEKVKQLLLQIEKANPGPYLPIKNLLEKIYKHEVVTLNNTLYYSDVGKVIPLAWNWPNPTVETRSLPTTQPFAKTFKFIDKKTPIGSCGSCFAIEIARYLQKNNYNYVVTESNINPTTNLHTSCTKWGTIFNTPSLRQLVEKAFGLRTTPKFLWQSESNGKPKFSDPFRENIYFDSVDEYNRQYDSHLLAAREAMLKVKTFIFTLGVNEIWYLKSDASIFSRCPWKFSPSLVETKVLSVEDNVHELQKALDTWKIFNPDLKMIVTVSPIPLMSTFRGAEKHVVEASCLSKSTLRVAAEIFSSRNKDVYYFPSYEKIMYCSDNPWHPDGRHVNPENVDRVMDMFAEMFVQNSVPVYQKSHPLAGVMVN